VQNEKTYETRGVLYFVTAGKGKKGLIGLDWQDYDQLLGLGFEDEEVYLTVKKAEYGSEYSQQVPEHKMQAGLCTVRVEGIPKYQLHVDIGSAEELLARGFKDVEKVALVIEKSPYRVPAKPLEFEELKFEL
jgi:hypothetical protein